MIEITRPFRAYFEDPSGWVERPCRFTIDTDQKMYLKDESVYLRPVYWAVVDMDYKEATELLLGPKPALDFQVQGDTGPRIVVRSDFERVPLFKKV